MPRGPTSSGLGDLSYESLEHLVERLPNMREDEQRDQLRPPNMQGLMAALWTHGGFHGVTKNAEKFSDTIRYVNNFMKEQAR